VSSRESRYAFSVACLVGSLIKMTPEGRVVMTLGTKGVAGEGPDSFSGPCDVAFAPNGDIFVADGHVNDRVVKFSKDGRFSEISALTLDGAPAETTAPAAAAPPTDIRPILEKKVPTLLIVSEQDVLLPPPIVEAMHRAMPGSQLVKVAGAGHSVYFEKAAAYNRLLLEFLGKHARG
jgi:pimeloyl-ACP methyl ester carboxylesterase